MGELKKRPVSRWESKNGDRERKEEEMAKKVKLKVKEIKLKEEKKWLQRGSEADGELRPVVTTFIRDVLKREQFP